MYHSISDSAARGFRRFALHPDEFTAQMDYLHDAGYQPVTMAEFISRRASGSRMPERTVVLTFDDAFADFYISALPVLTRFGFPATLFAPTGYIGSTARWLKSCGEEDRAVLSWGALRDVASQGIEVAAHSHAHAQLDRLPAGLVREDTYRSRCLLEDKLGLAVEGFAYPFGYWNRQARAAVAAAGFRFGCAVNELVATSADDVLTMPRLSVNGGIGVAGLTRLLAIRSGPRERISAACKRVTWQALRKGVRAIGGDPREGWSA